MLFFHAWLLRQPDPVDDVLRSVVQSAEKIVNGSVEREFFVCLVSRQIPSYFFCRQQSCSSCGKNVFFSVHGCCGRKILCTTLFVRLAEKITHGSV